MTLRKILLCGAIAIGAASGASVAMAQSAPPSASASATIEEVVVTARKREESLQSVPVAVSAISWEALARQGLKQPSDLTRTVPSLTITGSSPSTPTGAVISLRGQAASDVLLSLSQPVGLYEDSVNIPHAVGTNIAFFDLSRVEVLKGPQGTLYGRNTTGGAINIITRGADYDGIHGFAYLEGGNHGDLKYSGAINVPILQDVLAGRLAYQHWDRDGYGKSAITNQKLGGDHDDDIVRGSLKFDPAPYLSATAKLEYIKADRSDALFQTRQLGGSLGSLADTEWLLEGKTGGVAPSVLVANSNDLFTNYGQTNEFEKLTGWHGALDVNWDITDNIKLRSITGYHQFKDLRTFDLDGLPAQLNEVGIGAGGLKLPSGVDNRPLKPDQQSRQWTQEFNLSGSSFDDKLSWLVGAFASDDEGHANQTATVFTSLLGLGATGPDDFNFDELFNGVQTWALFTQDDIKFNDVFSITVGARYTEERLKQNIAVYNYLATTNPIANRFACTGGPNKGQTVATEADCASEDGAKFSGTSYLLSFNFQFTPDTLLYVKTARGFRGGALQVRSPDDPAAAPEIATDYELGFKSDFFERRLRTNFALYQTNYANKQETTILVNPVTNVTTTPIRNVASARIRGIEAEITAVPIDHLTLTATGDYLDGAYNSYKNALNPLGALVDASGQTFALPHWSYNIGGRYVIPSVGPGDIGLSANYAWHSKTNTNVLNFDPRISTSLQNEWRASRGLLNASIDYTLAQYGATISVFATNLTNEKYQVQGVTLPFGFQGVTQEPRMWGVSVRKTFGSE
jgi:iron complex outermembrane recepter protein